MGSPTLNAILCSICLPSSPTCAAGDFVLLPPSAPPPPPLSFTDMTAQFSAFQHEDQLSFRNPLGRKHQHETVESARFVGLRQTLMDYLLVFRRTLALPLRHSHPSAYDKQFHDVQWPGRFKRQAVPTPGHSLPSKPVSVVFPLPFSLSSPSFSVSLSLCPSLILSS